MSPPFLQWRWRHWGPRSRLPHEYATIPDATADEAGCSWLKSPGRPDAEENRSIRRIKETTGQCERPAKWGWRTVLSCKTGAAVPARQREMPAFATGPPSHG